MNELKINYVSHVAYGKNHYREGILLSPLMRSVMYLARAKFVSEPRGSCGQCLSSVSIMLSK